MRLVERVEYREGDEVWHGVRYEVPSLRPERTFRTTVRTGWRRAA
jgi:hypothetical protein